MCAEQQSRFEVGAKLHPAGPCPLTEQGVVRVCSETLRRDGGLARLAAGAIDRRVVYSASDKGRGRVVPLWDDHVRVAQTARLSADNLRWQYHEVEVVARELHAKAKIASKGFR